MASKFKSAATSRSFKSIGAGLQRGRQELEKQADIQRQALQLEKERAKEIANLQISGLADKGKFEQGVLGEKQKLENAVRNRKYEATKTHADTEVARLEGIAAEKKKYADHLKDLAPKQAAAFGKLAEGIGKFTQDLRADAAFKKLDDLGVFEKPIEEADKVLTKLLNNASVDISKLPTFEEKLAAYSKTFGSSFQLLHSKIYKRLNENWDAEIAGGKAWINRTDDRKIIDGQPNPNYGKPLNIETQATADEWWELYGTERLKSLGIKPNTKYGRAILAKFKAQGVLRSNEIRLSKKAERTENTILTGVQTLSSLRDDRTAVGPKGLSKLNSELNSLVEIASAGAYKTKNSGISESNIGRGEGFEIVGIKHVQVNTTDFKSRDDVKAFFEGLVTSDGELWSVKHASRIERIADAWEAANKDKVKEIEDTQIGNGNSLLVEYNNSAKEFSATPIEDRQKKYGYTTQREHNLYWTEKAVNGDIDDVNRTKILTSIGFTDDGAKHADKWIPLERLLLNENDELSDAEALQEVVNRWSDKNRFTPAERRALLPKIQPYLSLEGSGETPASLLKYSKGIMISDQGRLGTGSKGSSSLSYEGNIASERYVAKIIEINNALLQTEEFKGKPEAAMKRAKELVRAEFDRGANRTNPREYGDGDFARKSGTMIEGGTASSKDIYKNDATSDDEALFTIGTIQFTGDYEEGAYQYFGLSVNPYPPGTISNLGANFQNRTLQDWVEDNRAFPPQTIANWDKLARKLQTSEATLGDSVDIPHTVVELARLYNVEPIQIINSALKHRAGFILNKKGTGFVEKEGETSDLVLFAPDGNSSSMWRSSDDTVVKGPVSNNLASNIDQAMKKQFCIPMNQFNRMVTEGGLVPKDAYIQYTTGITNSQGFGYLNKDSQKAFLDANGIGFLSYEELDANFGINNMIKLKHLSPSEIQDQGLGTGLYQTVVSEPTKKKGWWGK